MRVRYRARAVAELDDIFRFLEAHSPTGARHVLATIHAAIGEIAAHPQASPRTSDPAIRVRILGGYRYRIFYAVEGTGFVEIIHVRPVVPRTSIGSSS